MKIKLDKEKKIIQQKERSITVKELEPMRIEFDPERKSLRVNFREGIRLEKTFEEDDKFVSGLMNIIEGMIKEE